MSNVKMNQLKYFSKLVEVEVSTWMVMLCWIWHLSNECTKLDCVIHIISYDSTNTFHQPLVAHFFMVQHGPILDIYWHSCFV